MIAHQIKALANSTTELLIYGDIGQDFWAEESNDAKTIVAKIAQITTTNIDVRINSNGGSVVDAIAIYNALKRHPGQITCHIDGVAFSAASLIAMAGDKVVMASNALLMIHAPWGYAQGNADEMRANADMLDKYADAMAQSYIDKSGKSKDAIDALLKGGQDNYYTAEEALAENFIDEIGVAVSLSIAAMSTRFNPPKAWLDANMLTITATVQPTQQQQQQRINPMSETTETPEKETNQPPPQAAAVIQTVTAQDKKLAELERQASIKAVFALVPETDKHIHAMQKTMLIDASITEEKARQQILAKMGENQFPVGSSHHVEMGSSGRERFIEAATHAILVMGGVEKKQPNNEFQGQRLTDIARACLVQASLATNMGNIELVKAAFTQSTSDFPILLENAMHKALLNSYTATSDTWTRFCATGSVTDFRDHYRYRVGAIGNLQDKNELGEYKNGTIPDGERATVNVATKGLIINISRESIINDDLSAFVGLASQLGRSAKRTIEAAVYSVLASNPTLASDGKALFHADHGNIGTAANVTTASVEEARKLMLSQKGVGTHADYLNLMIKIWLGGLANGGNARRVNTSEYDPDTANKLQAKNIYMGIFSDIIDTPRIAGNAWYSFADPLEAPVIEVDFLNGETEPYIELQQAWNTDGAAYKVRHDFGVNVIDYRGAVKNAGA